MHKRQTTPTIGTGISIAAHFVVFFVLILAGRQAWKARPPQQRGGDRTVLYWQGPSAAIQPRPKRVLLRKRSKNALTPPDSRPISKPQAAETLSKSGSDGLGTSSQDVTPAFPVFSPSPHLADRSLLPPSTRNVVVDVNVSAQGEVSDEKLVQGLGNNLDQVILDTVKTWKFHPASSDGNAVASIAELVFPLSPKWRG
jgi:TonB family protein